MPCVCCVCGWTRPLPEDVNLWPQVCGGSTDIYPITQNGRLDGQVQGFICARCLRNANEARSHVKALLSDVRVSRHAFDRFIERQEGEKITAEAAKVAIVRLYQRARPIVFREKFMTERLTNNGGKAAQYRYEAGWILVATEERPVTIMTIERNWHRKLGVDFWYTDEA